MYDIVIPSLYEVDKDYLKLCVESLRDSGFGGKIIVVTNGGHQPNLSHIKGISTHLHTKDQGQCGAVNRGAQLVDAPYMMVSNSDMYYGLGWDKNLRFDYPVFSPNLIEPTNNAGSAPPFLKLSGGNTIEQFDKSFVDNAGIRETLDEFDFWDDDKEDESNPGSREESGFNLPFFIKADFWRFLGGYDTAYDPWGSNSDTDLQTRINLAGVIPMRLRDVLVYHFSNKTPTFAPENDRFRLHNFDYFKEKFGFDRDDVDGKGLKSDVWYNKDMIPKDKERIKYAQKPYLA